MNDTPIQIALTGITGYALSYLDLFEKTPADQSELRTVTAINRDDNETSCRKLEKSGVEVFTDYSQMLETWKNRIELCVLPVPIHLHSPMTLQALSHGMNVLLEKPMAGSLEQGLGLCDADKGPHRIAIGFQDMYRPSTLKIASQLKAGKIGKIIGVHMMALWPRSLSYYRRNKWAGTVEADGQVVRDSPINNATAHFVNLALFFAGVGTGKMARARKVEAELFRARGIQSFDTAAIRVKTDTGIPLHLYATHCCRDQETATVTVRGEKGTMTWVQGKDVIWQTDGYEETVEIESIYQAKFSMWDSIIQSLRDGSEFLCTPEMAISHTELVEKLHLENQIRDLNPDLLVKVTEDGDERIYLPGMAEDLKRCREEVALPSELDLPWASK